MSKVLKLAKAAGVAGLGLVGLTAGAAAFGFGIAMRLVREGAFSCEDCGAEDCPFREFCDDGPDDPDPGDGEEDEPRCPGCAARDCSDCGRAKCVGCLCTFNCAACPYPAGCCACHVSGEETAAAGAPIADAPECPDDLMDDRLRAEAEAHADPNANVRAEAAGAEGAEPEPECGFICGDLQCEGCCACPTGEDMADERELSASLPDVDPATAPSDMTEPADGSEFII